MWIEQQQTHINHKKRTPAFCCYGKKHLQKYEIIFLFIYKEVEFKLI